MPRRIDALYCDAESASAKVSAMIMEIGQNSHAAKERLAGTMAQFVQSLRDRELALIAEIDEIATRKVESLKEQLRMIATGTCPPAPAEEQGMEPDPSRFLICSDAVVDFKLGKADELLSTISEMGRIEERSTYASRSYAKGPALGVLKVDNPSYCWVYACDREGSRRLEGGDTVIAMTSSPTDFEDLKVEDLQNGMYKVTFVPRSPGDFSLSLTLRAQGFDDDEEVHGGPFTLQVRPRTDYMQFGAEDAIDGKAKLGDHEGDLRHPSGVAFDHTGRFIFVVDQSHHRVQVFDAATQQPLSSFGRKGLGMQEFDTPCGVVADRENRVVVSDLLNHRLQVLEFLPGTGELRQLFAVGHEGSGPGHFLFPKGIGLTEHGQLLVCDSGNHRVQIFDTLKDFAYVGEFGSQGSDNGQFDYPLDVAVNCSGEVLVSDSNNRIQLFDVSGRYLRSFGLKGRKDGLFNFPTSLAVNDENLLFVCDQGNHRVQVFNASDGTFLHKWGGCKQKVAPPADGEEPAEGEEPPKPSWKGLLAPSGIAVNASGMVLVADYQNNTIFTF